MSMSSKVKKEDKESEDVFLKRAGAPILVVSDQFTGRLGAQFVQNKGVHDWSVSYLKDFVDSLGHKRVTMRDDLRIFSKDIESSP